VYKIVCDGPTGQNCHIYDYDNKLIRCVGVDVIIRPSKPTIAAVYVLVDGIEIEVDNPSVELEGRVKSELPIKGSEFNE
jgi:hypothetical protein